MRLGTSVLVMYEKNLLEANLEPSKCLVDVVVGKTNRPFFTTKNMLNYEKSCREIKVFWPAGCFLACMNVVRVSISPGRNS